MKRVKWFSCFAAAGLLAGCSNVDRQADDLARAELSPKLTATEQAIAQVRGRYAPDHHTAVFKVAPQIKGKQAVLLGEVSNPEAKMAVAAAFSEKGYNVENRIAVLPDPQLGEETNGISTLSVASGRENPGHNAEMGTQILMGHAFTVLKISNNWCLVQSQDRYLSWVQKGAFVRCTKERVEDWNKSRLLLVTAFEERVVTGEVQAALPVADVVAGCLVKHVGEDRDWYMVELPDGRSGYLLKSAATDYAEWKRTTRPTADGIERTAKTFMGRPYLWGGNSPKGLDCSGFTKLTFYLNGIDLNRNASQQVLQGTEVPLDAEYSQLKKGDLLFFGSRGGRGGRRSYTDDTPVPVGRQGPFITHVGIYLGDKLFIHSSEFVHINSLDPDSPLKDERRIRSLIAVRRVLPGS